MLIPTCAYMSTVNFYIRYTGWAWHQRPQHKRKAGVNAKAFAGVDHFTYLGSVMSKYANCPIAVKNMHREYFKNSQKFGDQMV